MFPVADGRAGGEAAGPRDIPDGQSFARFADIDRPCDGALTRGVTPSAAGHLELIASTLRRSGVSHVIFDFDGTISWLRHGWPDLMLELFLERAPAGTRLPEAFASEVRADILSLNGKPSIHQVLRFCERVREWGKTPPDPDELLREYQTRLARTVRDRVAALERGELQAADFLVAGAGEMIEKLLRRGLVLVILSGTVEEDVKREAELLGLTKFFGRHIYGSAPGTAFSKQDVIDRILREEQIDGSGLLAFGDGPVEIEFTKNAGGLAIGVASDEAENGSHRIDADKREQLIRAGADAIIPDYAEADALLAAIFRA